MFKNMNYFSKYINKYQSGGSLTDEDKQLFGQTLLICPEAYAQLAESAQIPISEEFLSGIAEAQGNQEAFGTLLEQYPEDAKNCFALFSQAKDQIVAYAQQKMQGTPAMKDGGKVNYLKILKGQQGMKGVEVPQMVIANYKDVPFKIQKFPNKNLGRYNLFVPTDNSTTNAWLNGSYLWDKKPKLPINEYEVIAQYDLGNEGGSHTTPTGELIYKMPNDTFIRKK